MNIVIVGGAGHVGLPLGIALAAAREDFEVVAYDRSEAAVRMISGGVLPFREEGAAERFGKVLGRNFSATTSVECLASADALVVTIGTPLDEHLNPTFAVLNEFVAQTRGHLRSGQTLILRSTVFPGTTEKLQRLLRREGLELHLAFCPERIAEGKAMTELHELPQIVSGFDAEALRVSKEIFGALTRELVELSPLEAELAKLYTNSWRYIQFAIANQFYVLADGMGVDFYRVYHAMTHDYPRAKDFPRAGFAAGPCLLKDTMQLSAFSGGKFFLGHSAMLINEGMPDFVVQQLRKAHDLPSLKIGILGMAFKGESDDKRDSLSYKLKKLLELEAGQVLCTDEYIHEPGFLPLPQLLAEADVLVVGAPHRRYRELSTTKPVVDIWNWTGR